MKIFDSLKTVVNNHFEKQKEEKEHFEKLKKEIAFQKRQVFEEEYKKNALEVAKSQARKEAAQKSGLQKMRAENRLRHLNKADRDPGSFFSKLSEHIQKNQARTAERMKITEEMRAIAKESREQQTSSPQRFQDRTKPKWY